MFPYRADHGEPDGGPTELPIQLQGKTLFSKITVVLMSWTVNITRVNTTHLMDLGQYKAAADAWAKPYSDWLCECHYIIFDPPQNRHPLINHQQILHGWLFPCSIYPNTKFVANMSTEGLWASGWVKYNNNFMYLFIYIPFWDRDCHMLVLLGSKNHKDHTVNLIVYVNLLLFFIMEDERMC